MQNPYTTTFQGQKPRPLTATRNWTLKRLEVAAASYSNRKDFEKGARFAYKAAKDMGILDQVCRYMPY